MEEHQRSFPGVPPREETSRPAKSKMTRWLMVGFSLTLLGALTIEVSVLLALGNLFGLEIVAPTWLIGAFLAGGALLMLGWLCRMPHAPSRKGLSP
jgi:hypothetical protein